MGQADGRWENGRWKMAVCMFVVKIAKSLSPTPTSADDGSCAQTMSGARKDRVSVFWHVNLTRVLRAETFGRPAFSFIWGCIFYPKHRKRIPNFHATEETRFWK